MFKSANVGNLDRIARILVGALLIALPYFYMHPMMGSPIIRWAMPIIGVVLIVTALFRFCPLYRLIGVNTCKIG